MQRTVAFAVAACVSGILLGCGPTAPAEDEETPAVTKPIPVQAVKAEPTTLRPTLDLVGTVVVIPEKTALISSQTSGWIEKVAVVDGATVVAGADVVLLDPRLAEIAVARATAAVAEKQAALARLKRGYLPQEIEMARHEVVRAEQQVKAQQIELDALTPLWKRKEVSNLQYEKVKLALRGALAARAAAEAKVKLYEAGTPKEEIAEADAQLATAKAELRQAKLNLQFCRITAPLSGTVMQLTARRGMFVDRATSLLTIADLTTLFVKVRVPVDRADSITIGTRADVFLDDYRKEHISGKVARISGQADSATGDLIVSVQIPNNKMRLRPGRSCRTQLWLPPLKNVLAIPAIALADRSGTPVVTVARDGKAYEIEVVPGARTHDYVEIKKGLAAGDWVITHGGYGLPDGCPVKVVNKHDRSTAEP